jgi:hypothetical protein
VVLVAEGGPGEPTVCGSVAPGYDTPGSFAAGVRIAARPFRAIELLLRRQDRSVQPPPALQRSPGDENDPFAEVDELANKRRRDRP